jgi:hypothetical protein
MASLRYQLFSVKILSLKTGPIDFLRSYWHGLRAKTSIKPTDFCLRRPTPFMSTYGQKNNSFQLKFPLILK